MGWYWNYPDLDWHTNTNTHLIYSCFWTNYLQWYPRSYWLI